MGVSYPIDIMSFHFVDNFLHCAKTLVWYFDVLLRVFFNHKWIVNKNLFKLDIENVYGKHFDTGGGGRIGIM